MLITNNLQKVSTQFNEGQQQLTYFSEANKTLKKLVQACTNKITDLEKTVKSLDKKNNQGN